MIMRLVFAILVGVLVLLPLRLYAISARVQCDASFDPATGKAVLPCIDTGDGEVMFDVDMQHDRDLLFRITDITPYWYDQKQNEIGISSIEVHFIPAKFPFSSSGIPTVWGFLLIDVESLNLCGRVRGTLKLTHRPITPEDKGRIDVRVFLQECHAPGLGPRHSGLTGIFQLDADSTYEIYVGGKLRKTIQVPAASTQ